MTTFIIRNKRDIRQITAINLDAAKIAAKEMYGSLGIFISNEDYIRLSMCYNNGDKWYDYKCIE